MKWKTPHIYKQIINLNKEGELWSVEEISRWQFEKILDIVNYAYSYVPGYKSLYKEAGIYPMDIKCWNDFSRLPFITKEMIRDNLKDFTSTLYSKNKLIYQTTGGSTGIPFGFYNTKKDQWIENAFVAIEWSEVGWNLNMNGTLLRGAYVGDKNHIGIISRNRGIYLPNKSYSLSPYHLSEDNYQSYISFLKKNPSDYIFAYPSSITALSKLILDHEDSRKLQTKLILLGSENVYDWQIEIMKKAFPTSIIHSCYGQSEKVIIAHWCKDTYKYHLNPFYGYTELLAQSKQASIGQIGELVGTSFWLKATPFIRYKTMDYAVNGGQNCNSCGRKFQVLDRIDGRLNEVIVSKDGRQISMTSINMHDSTFDCVSKFRFIQNEPGKCILQIVPKLNAKINEDYIINSLKNKLGNDFFININIVPDILPSKSGKFSFIQQNISIDGIDRLKY